MSPTVGEPISTSSDAPFGEGAFTVLACQRCGATRSIQETATLTIPAAFSPWWIGLGAAVLALVLSAAVAVHRFRRPRPPIQRPSVRLRPAELRVSIVIRQDGSAHHAIELVPHADPGLQQLRERTPR